MVKPDLGIKRVCPSCAARFYDLQKRPIECPKCAYTFEPESLLRQRRPRVPEPVQKAVPVEADEEAEDTEAEEVEDEAADEVEEEEPAIVDEAPLDPAAEEDEEATPESDNVGVSVKEGEAEEEEDILDEEIDDDEEDDDLLEEVEEDEEDVSGIIDADIEKEEP